MNNLITQLNDIVLQESPKLHQILDKVVDEVVKIFEAKENGPEILFSPSETAFITNLDSTTRLVIQRNFAKFGVDVDIVVQDTGSIAHCELNTRNGFNQSFGRLSKELKPLVNEIFDKISEIDINATDEETPVEETPTVPESEVDVIEPQQ